MCVFKGIDFVLYSDHDLQTFLEVVPVTELFSEYYGNV